MERTCPDCGHQINKNYTRCRNCEDLKFKFEQENLDFNQSREHKKTYWFNLLKQRSDEVMQNRIIKKNIRKQLQLDSALAWGTAISSLEANEIEKSIDNSEKSTNFCSVCGQKLNIKDIYCSKCGNNLQQVSRDNPTKNIYDRRYTKKKSLIAIITIFVLLLLFIIIKSEIINFTNPNNKPISEEVSESTEATNSVDTNSREYSTGLIIGGNFSDVSDAGAKAEDVCATARDRRVVINSRGGLGVDPRTATFLKSTDGFQGCIDGFNGVPQD